MTATSGRGHSLDASMAGAEDTSPPPRLRDGIDLTRAGLSVEEGFLVSRIDGRTRVPQLAVLVGKPVEETQRLVDRLTEVGILVTGSAPGGNGDGDDPYDGFRFPSGALSEPVDLELDEMKRILYTHAHLGEWSHYRLLGVRWRDDAATVKKAYFARSKEWHPDRFRRGNLGSYKPRIEAIFKAVNEAYQVLRDPKKKKAYDDAHAREFDEEDMAEALKAKRREDRRVAREAERKRRLRERNPVRQRMLRAKAMYEEALAKEEQGDLIDALRNAQGAYALHAEPVYKEVMERLQRSTAAQRIVPLLKRGKHFESLTHWDQAIAVFGEAVRQAPENGEARLRLAYNLLMGGRPPHEANEHAQKAVQLLSDEPEAHYVRGMFYERSSMEKAAVRAYERAVELRPRYEAVQKRLRKLKWGF